MIALYGHLPLVILHLDDEAMMLKLNLDPTSQIIEIGSLTFQQVEVLERVGQQLDLLLVSRGHCRHH